MDWRSWNELGGDLKAGATPTLAGSQRRDLSLVARLANDRVGLVSRSSAGWFVWDDLGLPCRDQPAVALVNGFLVVAARGTDDGLWLGGAAAWTPAGGSIASAPSIAHWYLDGNAEIFARGVDGTLKWFSFSAFGTPAVARPSPGSQQISGAPAAVAPGPNGIHVVARRAGDSRLIHASWNYRSWTPWTDLGEVITCSPVIVSRDIGSAEIYFSDTSGALIRRSFSVGSGGQLVPAGSREVLAPQLLGDPAAASFGPWHVEVFHRQSNGVLARVYGEGVPREDATGLDLLDDQVISSAPSAWARAQDSVVCAARNARNELVTIAAEDGYWGNWQNRGGFIDSDPVAVTRIPSFIDVVARDNAQRLVRWSLRVATWSGPETLPPPTSGWCVGQPRVFADGHGGYRIVTRTTTDRLLEAVIAPSGAFVRWNDLLGGTITQQPELVHVPRNELAAPFAGMTPAFAMEAGTWVVVPGANGVLRGRLFRGGAWGPWQNFSTRSTTVRRPIAIVRDGGFPFAVDSSRIGFSNQAGWIGRAPNGDVMQQRMVWLRVVGAGVVAVVLDSTSWTASSTFIELAADPTGVHLLEPFFNTPGDPDMLVTHVFGRSPQGHVRWLPITAPAPGALAWNFVAQNYRIGGDVAAWAQWSRFENRQVLYAAATSTGGSLIVGFGGLGAAPQRTKPRRTIIKPPRPPRPPRPIRPPNP